MLKTVAGIYQNGQIELSELPADVSDRAQVIVTFVEPGKVDPSKLRQLIDQLETIAQVQQGFEEIDAGQTRPLEDFIAEMQQKYDISG
jgi:cell division FtsZ-interacting protein ZapD